VVVEPRQPPWWAVWWIATSSTAPVAVVRSEGPPASPLQMVAPLEVAWMPRVSLATALTVKVAACAVSGTSWVLVRP
jgi:hypothetical protein